MSTYGLVIDDEVEHTSLLDYFDDYFNHPTLYKIKDIDIKFSLYMVKTYCLLNTQCRYIIMIVPFDTNSVNFPLKMRDVDWVSLQTRELSENHKIPSHNYQPSSFLPLNKKIERIEQNESMSTYICKDYPLTIKLLQKKGMNEFQSKGTIITALETYQTIITHGNDVF
jgi:hypothetical protein